MDTVTHEEEAAGTRRVDLLLAHYGESHLNPRNEAIHMVAIPLIVLSLVGLLYVVHPWLAFAAVVASWFYYARLSIVFLIAMAAMGIACLLAVAALGDAVLPFSVLVFVVSWIAQFVGHKIEGKKPSFFEDLQYLLVGPLFVLSRLFLKFGIRW